VLEGPGEGSLGVPDGAGAEGRLAQDARGAGQGARLSGLTEHVERGPGGGGRFRKLAAQEQH
jgi:hypothetical protein